MVNASTKAKADDKPEVETPVEPTTEPAADENPAPEPEPATDEAKPRRLSAVERLQKQLDDAREAAKAKAGNKLGKAQEELAKATTDAERANARLAAAHAAVNELSAQAGGVDPIVAASTAAALEAEQQGSDES